MKKASASILALALAAFATASAAAEGFSYGVAGLRRNWFAVPTGLDMYAAYEEQWLGDGLATELWAKAGGGYEARNLFRDKVTGDPLSPSDAADTNAYTWANFQWELGVIQGIVQGGYKADLLEAFAFYRGRFDKTVDGAGTTPAFGDWDELFYTGFIGGLSWNGLFASSHGLKSGVYAEASFEVGPGALNAYADYWRASAKAIGALPLFGDGEDMAGFQGYLAEFVSADYADGDAVPAFVNQSFGGRDLRDSLGTCVRGYAGTAYDAKLKAVNNLEFRLLMPSFAKESLYPVAYAFFDAGYYAGYAGSSAHADDSGYLASVGGGIALDILRIAQLGVAVGQPLLEKSSFWWDIKLFLHF